VQRYDPDQTREVKFFEMSAALSNSVFRLASYIDVPTVELTPEDPDILYVMNNCINDALIHTENIYTFIQEDVESKLMKLEIIILVLDLAIVTLGGFIFAVTVRNEVLFLKRRKVFVEAFVRIKNHEMDSHIMQTKRFEQAL